MSRKTIAVNKVKKYVNSYLAHPNSSVDGREAMMSLIEAVLMETENYNGYRYLSKDETGLDEVEGAGSRVRYY
tara:strand:- start:3352 stop:3570 length:219 start_codon:yes stop_codon:yes gene_type:complete